MTAAVDYVQIMTTTDSEEEATRLAQKLLQDRLVACVQIVSPVTSHYWWQGTLEQVTEWLCVIKTRGELLDTVVETLNHEHSYDTPEITATPIVGGSDRYLDWIRHETRT
jgi:periplasmic divalent cation tolerance protein